MQIMFGTILWVLLKGLILTKATNTPKLYGTSNILQEENVSRCPELNFTEDISMSDKSDHHILNFKSDRSHFDRTVRNKREVPDSIESSLNKPTSLRAFVQFDSQFTEKVNDIFVTLRWNHPEFSDEIIQMYQVQCSFFEDFKETCDDKNITATKLEHTVHNLTFNTTYYFRVRAHTKIIAGPYTNLINVSTTHENPIPKLLLTKTISLQILDVDLNYLTRINVTKRLLSKFLETSNIIDIAYSIQEHRIYCITLTDLITWKINKNDIRKINKFEQKRLHNICIDWVARNLYITCQDIFYFYIMKSDLTMWENGIIKFDKIFKSRTDIRHLNVSPSMGTLYFVSYNSTHTKYDIMKYHLNGKIKEIIRINASFCLFHEIPFLDMIIDDMNNEEPLIYWFKEEHIFVTDINISMCNMILHKKNINDNIHFVSMTIDKTNIYILAANVFYRFPYILYILKKKYAGLKSVNAAEYVKKIIISSDNMFYNLFYKIDAFDKSLQPYPPMRCLTPEENVSLEITRNNNYNYNYNYNYNNNYNFEDVQAGSYVIFVNLSEPVVKSGCEKYNLPTTIYTISVSCFNNNLNKSEKFKVQTFQRYYEISNLTPFTEYKLQFTLSNFYFDQLTINPFDSNVIAIKTKSGKIINELDDISVLALTPTIAVVHWMPPKELNCLAVTYEVHWESVIIVNGTQQKSKQFINVQKHTADGRFFTKINLSLSVQDLIYVRVYPNNFSDLYSESLSKIIHIYSEPNNITLSGVNINSMNISWISNINRTIYFTLEYKDIVAEKWQTMNDYKMNYKDKVICHVKNLQSGTLYKFRLILRYLEYEETFIWPADERFIFLTHGSKRDISSIPGITEDKYYLLLLLSFVVIIAIICVFYIYRLFRESSGNEQLLSSTKTGVELKNRHEVPWQNTLDECEITKIAQNRIRFINHLGSGAFGVVREGKMKDLEKSGTEISVAIKTLRKDACSHEKKELLKEAKTMNSLEHEHILKLLGVCLDVDPPLLVMELMETGDLLKYLRECRNLLASDPLVLSLHDLLAMCEDVARGCCYLEEKRFVHKDLACRNCLVSSRNRENRIIKIGDFGLSRDIYKDDYYRVEGEGLLPIRWMAFESLMIKKFTSQSDVWSFGVLMWEITSLGEQPYSAKTDEEVINYVLAGGRLSITSNCPPRLYDLMQNCWSAAAARPNFQRCLNNITVIRENIKDDLLRPVDII